MSRILTAIIRSYQRTISPDHGQIPMAAPSCRFEPTCSAYALEAFERFGLIRAFGLTVRRLLRCHPWHPGGFDPLPEHKP